MSEDAATGQPDDPSDQPTQPVGPHDGSSSVPSGDAVSGPPPGGATAVGAPIGGTPGTPAPYGGPYASTPAPPPYPPQPGLAGYPPPAPPAASGAGRLPGWAWPVIAAMALVVGLLGGVVGGVAVSTSLDRGTTTAATPPLSTDNGAAAPLKADNGSIAAVAARVLPSTVQVLANGGADGGQQGGATGSGFVLDGRGHVVTNNHVVASATGKGEIAIVDQNGTKHAARIVGRSAVYDLAVLEISNFAKLRPAAIGSASALRVGDTVVAIGSPLGLSSTVTSGIVSATNRPVTTGSTATSSSYINALQTDAAINPGNSGGPLVNLRGQVIGVNSAIATTGGSVGGESGNIGVGFAIPMEQVRVTAAQILSTGKARYPVIGANVDTEATTTGAVVTAVPTGSPAARGGLAKGDVVTRVDGKPVTDGIGLIVAIRSHQPGQTVDLRIVRGGRQRDVRVVLDSKVG